MILAAAIVAFCAYTGILFFRSHAGMASKLAALPIMIAAGLGLYLHYLAVLGAPIRGMPKTRFLYVHHVVADQGKIIFLWAYVPHVGNRLYGFPYSRGDEKALEAAQKGEKAGHPQMGMPTHGKKSSGSGGSDFDFTNGERLMGHDIPKGAP